MVPVADGARAAREPGGGLGAGHEGAAAYNRPMASAAVAAATVMARRHRALLAAAALVVGGGGAAGAAVGLRSANPVPPWVLADCGRGVSGHGFRAFACESGGAAAGHPHPKELLVLRDDGSSVAYPEWGGQGVAAGDGDVVAFHERTAGGELREIRTSITRDDVCR